MFIRKLHWSLSSLHFVVEGLNICDVVLVYYDWEIRTDVVVVEVKKVYFCFELNVSICGLNQNYERSPSGTSQPPRSYQILNFRGMQIETTNLN